MFMEIKELLLLSGIVTGNYEVDFDSNIQIQHSSRRGSQFILPRFNRELLRDNFFYRSCYRANVLSSSIDISNRDSLKNTLLKIMWTTFDK